MQWGIFGGTAVPSVYTSNFAAEIKQSFGACRQQIFSYPVYLFVLINLLVMRQCYGMGALPALTADDDPYLI